MASDQTDPQRNVHDSDTPRAMLYGELYPDPVSVFNFKLKPIDTIKDTCLVVLDTNALLVPYTIGQETLNQIAETYRSLLAEQRLIVPGQVAREFARHRATKIVALYQNLSDRRNLNLSKVQKGPSALLRHLPKYQEVARLEDQINIHVVAYREAIGELMRHIKQWTWNDPVSLLYGDLFSEQAVIDPDFEPDDVNTDWERRKTHSIPPGYKDKGMGDLLIWRTILELGTDRKTDVILVSGDLKADWWHRSANQALYPRHELVEEFRRASDGNSFYILVFSDFLSLFGANQQAVAEARRHEVQPEVLSILDLIDLDQLLSARDTVRLYFSTTMQSLMIIASLLSGSGRDGSFFTEVGLILPAYTTGGFNRIMGFEIKGRAQIRNRMYWQSKIKADSYRSLDSTVDAAAITATDPEIISALSLLVTDLRAAGIYRIAQAIESTIHPTTPYSQYGDVLQYRPDFFGQLPVKCTESPHIYRIENGHKRWIKDIPSFLALGFNWLDVRLVSCQSLRRLPDGLPIPPDAGPAPQP